MSIQSDNEFRRAFFGDQPIRNLPDDIFVAQTPALYKLSPWSRRFWKAGVTDFSKDSMCAQVKDIVFRTFGIPSFDDADELFRSAITGKGNEWKTITTLHSSALCAFLHFYNVKEAPLWISLDGKDHPVCFDKAVFEFEMPCVSSKSSMDVVLQSEDNKTLLFLESKFSEYLSIGEDKRLKLKSYGDCFKMFETNGQKWILGKDLFAEIAENGTSIRIKNNTYDEGLKQIICHYIALIKWGISREDPKSRLINPSLVENIYFSELLFDFENLDQNISSFDAEARLENYISASGRLMETLRSRKETAQSGIILNSHPLLYFRDIYCPNKQNINQTVAEYYHYANRKECF